jgi:hypothetical protein
LSLTTEEDNKKASKRNKYGINQIMESSTDRAVPFEGLKERKECPNRKNIFWDLLLSWSFSSFLSGVNCSLRV